MRINKKNKKKILIAVALGGLATFLLFNSMNSKQAAVNELNRKLQEQQAAIANLKQNPFDEKKQQKETKIEAVVAVRDINVGETYTLEVIKAKEFPEDILPEGYFKTTALVVGKKAGKNLVKGQFITSTEIQAEDIASIEIPNDMRAISIPVERFRGLASHIRVGSTVDLLRVSTPPDFIAQNLRIVAFEATDATGNSRYNANGNNRLNPQYLSANQASAITFLVPLDLVSKVIDNMLEGQLQIITRNSSDDKVLITEKELPPPPEETIPQINIPEQPLNEVELEPVKLPKPEPKKIQFITTQAVSEFETLEFEEEEAEEETGEENNAATSSDIAELKELLDMVR